MIADCGSPAVARGAALHTATVHRKPQIVVVGHLKGTPEFFVRHANPSNGTRVLGISIIIPRALLCNDSVAIIEKENLNYTKNSLKLVLLSVII